jgi:hypothetical protein
MHPPPNKPTLAAAFILLGLLTLFLSRDITRLGLGDTRDPGPHAFPVALALLLLAGGVVEVIRWIQSRPAPFAGSRPGGSAEEASPALAPGPWSARPLLRLSLLLLLLFTYFAMLGWAGFALSTLILAPLMMLLLGARTGTALLNSLVLILLVKGLFGWALKVPLPLGELGIPF